MLSEEDDLMILWTKIFSHYTDTSKHSVFMIMRLKKGSALMLVRLKQMKSKAREYLGVFNVYA